MTQPDTLAAVQAFVAAVAKVRVAEGWRFDSVRAEFNAPTSRHSGLWLYANWAGPETGTSVQVMAFHELSAHIGRLTLGSRSEKHRNREVAFAELAQAVEAMMGTEVEK